MKSFLSTTRGKIAFVLALAMVALGPVAMLPATAVPYENTGGVITNPLPDNLEPRGYKPHPDICPSEAEECVDQIVQRMENKYDALGCSHNAAFSVLYLVTTYNIRAAIRNDEFSDRPFWNRIANTFGTYYLDQYDAWESGNKTKTSTAWQIAFEAAKEGQTSTVGDVFLGINAHVNRDLAFVYYQTDADSYADHNHVNEVLRPTQPRPQNQNAWGYIYAQLDNTAFAQLGQIPAGVDLDVIGWREIAWQNYQRLKAAPNADARAVIAAEIEANAVAKAKQIRKAFPAAEGANATRDAYCATHKP